MLVGEIAPVVLEPVIVPLAMLAALIVAFGIVYMVEQIVRALFGTASGAVGWIPWLGSRVQGTLHSIEQRITSALGAAEHSIDGRMGRYLTALGQSIAWVVNEIRAHSSLLWTLATLTLGSATTTVLHLAIVAVTRAAHVAMARIHALTAAVHVVTAGALPALRHWTVSHVTALEHTADVVLPREIKTTRTLAKEAERSVANLWDYMRTHPWLAVTPAFLAAITVALGRLGMGWLKCNSVSRIGQRLGCRGFGLLEDLLFGVIDVLVIADLCRLTGVMIDVAESSVVQDALGGIIGGIDGLLLCQGVTRPDALDGYWTDPPPLQAFSALPAV